MRHFLLLLLLLPWAASAEPLRVFVSVLPIQTLTQMIGGEQVDVRSLVGRGYSPATYDPTPQQVAALAQADLYLRIGVPFENAWMARIKAANPAMPLVDLREGLHLRELEAHDHGHHDEHAHDSFDPHLWTSPRESRLIAQNILQALLQLAPQQRALFESRHAQLDQQLQALDDELSRLLTPLHGRSFLVFHPAWGYFAERYHLRQIAIEFEGKQAGARQLAELIEQAQHLQVRAIFVQPQFDRRQAQRIAQAIKAQLIDADPLSPDYFANLRQVARDIAETLQP